MSLLASPTEHELESRTSDGIHVRLLWDMLDGQVSVAVEDRKSGEAFRVAVRSNDRALDVFHHPYAYAAWQGVDTHVAAPAAGPSAGGPEEPHGERDERHAHDAVERA